MKGYSIIIYLCFVFISANMKCFSESPPTVPKYYLIEKCHRSKLAVVAKANYTSLMSCQQFGIKKKALALNFSPPDAMNGTNGKMEFTCEVLKCAEVKGGVSLTNDTKFDYYSIYANPIPNINTTCVGATGMFYLLGRKRNYTEAEMECKNMSGVLADVTSEQRTEILAQFLAEDKIDAAYVGMRRYNSTMFTNINGDSLECTTYRAWAPGHPRKQYKQYECAVITRDRTWESAPCADKYFALCELQPAGPYKIGSIYIHEEKGSAPLPASMPSDPVTATPRDYSDGLNTTISTSVDLPLRLDSQ